MMRDYVRINPVADIYIVDKTEQSYLLSLLPSKSYRVVDIHDLISVKSSNMKSYDLVHGMVLAEEQEIKLLRQYDGVICIQEEDRRGHPRSAFAKRHKNTTQGRILAQNTRHG